MAKLKKCPSCVGAIKTVLGARCTRCNGFGQVVDDAIVSFAAEVEAVFSLKDGSFLQIKLQRDSAQTYVVLDLSEPGMTNIPCSLHHIDTDGIFHYEESPA